MLTLDDAIHAFGLPDLSSEQGRADHRSHVLLMIVLHLQELPQLEPLPALELHAQILRQIRTLHALALLTDEQLAQGYEDLRSAYARDQPHLLDQLRTH
jgi:hypothetical protein